MQRKPYTFTQNWFDRHIPNWENHCLGFATQAMRILEVGAFEGASTTWILDTLLVHELSELVTLDSFTGGVEHRDSQDANIYHLESLEARFWQNIYLCKGKKKLQLIKGDSVETLTRIRLDEVGRFDLIYIDGSHLAADVLTDALLSWSMLKVGGLLVFDDYKWDHYIDPHDNPRLAIDCFVKCFAPFLEVVQVGYQVWLRKIKRQSVPIERS